MSSISATEARMHLGEMIEAIDNNCGPIFVETDDQPSVVLVTPDEYEALATRDRWQQVLNRRDGLAKQFQEGLGGRPQPDWEQLIREGREDR